MKKESPIFGLVLLLSICSLSAYAQIGGRAAFDFLQLSPSARIAAEGGTNVSLADSEPSMLLANPATLNSEMHQHAAFNFSNYYAGINNTTLAYAHESKKLKGMFGVGFQYVGYGDMKNFDAGGNSQGDDFSAADHALSLAYASKQGPFTLAGALKYAGSRIDTYKSSALLVDAGVLFNHPERDFNVGLTVRNAGVVLKSYSEIASKPRLPLNVQLGASYKLEHMPLRFSLTAHNLQTLDIVYLDPSNSTRLDGNGNPIIEKKSTGDKVLRHFTAGGEFLLGKKFNLRFGYNHLARREMRLESKRGTSGFSWGFMIKVKSFEIAYSRATYHLAGGTGYISITSNLGRLFGKKTSELPNIDPLTPSM